MGGHQNPIATLSVNIPITRLTEESEVSFGAAVSEAASRLSARIGLAPGIR
jgi:IclR family acetate operon transcriptional repressor